MLTDNAVRKNIWEKKTILRAAYSDICDLIKSNMSKVAGLHVEIGSGFGNIKEFIPDILTSDITPADSIDIVCDAMHLPFDNSAVANIVMIDTFHHVADPLTLLSELYRVLKTGGRVVMVEPFPSLLSLQVYKRLHDEPFNFNVDVFSLNIEHDKNPWESNQALPYLMFFKESTKFKKLLGGKFDLNKAKVFSTILYPASGGYSGRQLIPNILIPIARILEKILIPFNNYIGFRCLIVLEKVA